MNLGTAAHTTPPPRSHPDATRAGTRNSTPRTVTASTPDTTSASAPAATRQRHGPGKDADAMAVASFVAGLVGLLVFNLVLGPCAIVLSGLALFRGSRRRGRALLGLTLGVVDLVILATLVTADSTVTWHIS